MAEHQGSIIKEYLGRLKGGVKGFAKDEGERSFIYRHTKKRIVEQDLIDFLKERGHNVEKIINDYRATKMQQFVPTTGDNEYFKSQYESLKEEMKEIKSTLQDIIKKQTETIQKLIEKQNL